MCKLRLIYGVTHGLMVVGVAACTNQFHKIYVLEAKTDYNVL